MDPTQDQSSEQDSQPEQPVSSFSPPVSPEITTTPTETPTPSTAPSPVQSFGQPPKKKHGALIILLIVLVILLAGALGYILYTNTKKTPVASTNTSKSTTKSTTSSTGTTSTLSQIATDQVFGSGLSIKYPSTWTDKETSTPIPSNANSNTDLSGVNDTNVLTSPDGKVSVTLDEYAAGSKPGGTCDGSPGYGGGTLVAYTPSPMTWFPNATLLSYIDSANSQLQYGFGVMTTSTASGFSQNGTDCGIGLGFSWNDATIKSSSLAATDSGFAVNVRLTTQLLSLGSAPATSTFANVPSTTTQAEIQSALDSSDATTAKTIMQSLYIKS